MNSKEKILDGIKAAAATEADEILSLAQKKAEKIIAEAKQRAEDSKKEAVCSAENKAAAILKNSESSKRLVVRDNLLSFKRNTINELLVKAVDEINSYNDEEYFNFLYSIAEKNATLQGGILCLNEKDLSRELAEFEKKVEALELKISKEAIDSNGGFILKYNDISINCTFSALINEKSEQLTDCVNKILFV